MLRHERAVADSERGVAFDRRLWVEYGELLDTQPGPAGRGGALHAKPRYPGTRVTVNGNQLVSYHTEARVADAGVFYPITPSTEGGELYQQSFGEGRLNVFGRSTLAVEAEGEHAAQGGAIAHSVCGHRVVNFTSGQGIVYGVEQYYHAPGKCSTMVLEVVARALTKHALNVHCGHDDVYGALDTGWIVVFAKDAQQAADQALILRRVTELSLTPGMNVQDGFLTSHESVAEVRELVVRARCRRWPPPSPPPTPAPRRAGCSRGPRGTRDRRSRCGFAGDERGDPRSGSGRRAGQRRRLTPGPALRLGSGCARRLNRAS